MTETTPSISDQWPDSAGLSLGGFYVISVLAMGIGISVVFVLNFATPTDFTLTELRDDFGIKRVERPIFANRI